MKSIEMGFIMRSFITAALLLMVGGLSGPALAIALTVPPGDGPVLVLAAPWSAGAAAIIRASGGTVVGPRDRWLAALATAPVEDAGFVERLQSLGAWHLLDGTAVATLCGGRAS